MTNAAQSPLAAAAELALVTEAGAERAVPATKTFVAQLAALAVLGVGLGTGLDPDELRQVPGEIERMLAEPGDIEGAAAALAGAAGMVVSGRGLAYAAALELALKLKEACYLHAMGLSYADLLHGPIAVVDAGTPAIIVAADSGPALDGAVRLARRVTGAGATALAVGGGPALAAECSSRAARPPAARMAGPDRPHRARAAAHRGAGPPAWPQPGQPARAEQGHPDRLTRTRYRHPMATLVSFHAHPDDESIICGGVLRKASEEGHRVVLVLATRGEHGEVEEGFLADGESLAERRVAETQAAAGILGVERLEFLGYVDSGMMGTPANDAPGSFWSAPVDDAAREARRDPAGRTS